MRGKLKHLLLVFGLITCFSSRAQFIPEIGEWFHFSYSKLQLINAPEELKQKWNSQGWQLMLMRESMFGKRSHFGIAYGIGFSSHYWHTNLNISSNPQGGNLNYTYLPSDSIYKCNRFSASYIDIPVELRYRSKSNSRGRYFRFYAGGLVGYRINSFSQFRVNDYDVKTYRINDLSRWHYGVFFRTGYWLFNVYVFYNLSPVFGDLKDGVGPKDLNKMQSLSIGLSLSI